MREAFHVLALAAALVGVTAPAAAQLQIHGFAAQGFLLSEGNNYYGDSTHGSFDFYEAAVNASLPLTPELHASTQVFARDAGEGDNGKLRLDYALLDWLALQEERYTGGLRLGRIKNPFGLHNETRDVIFARPSILLPQSVYFDGSGLRGLFFSSDGAQLYGNYSSGAHEWSLAVSGAFDRQLSKKEKQAFIGKGPVPDEVGLRDLRFAQLADRWNGGRGVVALSYLHARLELDPQPSYPITFEGNFDLYVLSALLNAEQFSLTAEYLLTRLSGNGNTTGRFTNDSDGGYVQLDYRPAPGWTVFGRWDSRFANLHDRDGREAADNGTSRYLAFAHDAALGAGWTPDEHWGVWAEVHRIYGTLTVPPLDNATPSSERDPRWTLFAMMLGYRF